MAEYLVGHRFYAGSFDAPLAVCLGLLVCVFFLLVQDAVRVATVCRNEPHLKQLLLIDSLYFRGGYASSLSLPPPSKKDFGAIPIHV